MDDELLEAFRQVPLPVIAHLAAWAQGRPTPEERGGAASAVCYLLMRTREIPVLAGKGKILNG
jgi:hypothetical protein